MKAKISATRKQWNAIKSINDYSNRLSVDLFPHSCSLKGEQDPGTITYGLFYHPTNDSEPRCVEWDIDINGVIIERRSYHADGIDTWNNERGAHFVPAGEE